MKLNFPLRSFRLARNVPSMTSHAISEVYLWYFDTFKWLGSWFTGKMIREPDTINIWSIIKLGKSFKIFLIPIRLPLVDSRRVQWEIFFLHIFLLPSFLSQCSVQFSIHRHTKFRLQFDIFSRLVRYRDEWISQEFLDIHCSFTKNID